MGSYQKTQKYNNFGVGGIKQPFWYDLVWYDPVCVPPKPTSRTGRVTNRQSAQQAKRNDKATRAQEQPLPLLAGQRGQAHALLAPVDVPRRGLRLPPRHRGPIDKSISVYVYCVYICVYIYIYTYIHMYTLLLRLSLSLSLCICVCISLSLSLYVYIYVYVCIYIYIYIYVIEIDR